MIRIWMLYEGVRGESGVHLKLGSRGPTLVFVAAISNHYFFPPTTTNLSQILHSHIHIPRMDMGGAHYLGLWGLQSD